MPDGYEQEDNVPQTEFRRDNGTDNSLKIKLSSVFVCLLPTLLRMVKAVFVFLFWLLLWLPKLVFHFSTSHRLSINFLSFLVLCTVTTYVAYTILKNRVFSEYKKLTPDFDEGEKHKYGSAGPSRKNSRIGRAHEEAQQERNENSRNRKLLNEDTDEPFFSLYLDQFLSAIKIFGYLEKPVFHDLTKNMKTQKLDEGEILLLDNSIGFAIVIEGSLQIYHEVETENHPLNTGDFANDHEMGRSDEGSEDENEESSDNSSDSDIPDYTENDSSGYIHLKNGLGKFQLLNTVKPGNPVSSLATILTLFTTHPSVLPETMHSTTVSSRRDSLQEQLYGFTMQNDDKLQPKSSRDNISHSSPLMNSIENPNIVNLGMPIPNVLARAGTDCTIAIIPPQSFANLTEKYPRSVCHIIQMILTKIYHVTFQTVHKYLGLTDEIMQIERILNRSVDFEFPTHLKELAVKTIKHNNNDQWKSQKEVTPNMLNFSTGSIHRDSSRSGTRPHIARLPSQNISIDTRDQFNPGDLISNTSLSKDDLSSDISHSPSNLDFNLQETVFMRTKSPLSTKMDENNQYTPIKSSFLKQDNETQIDILQVSVVEAMFAYLNINEANMTIKPASEHINLSNIPTRNGSTTTNLAHHPSDVSLISSFASTSRPKHTLRILPSDFALKSPKVRKNKKKHTYREEVSPNLDYGSVKKAFAKGVQFKFYKKGSKIVEQDSNGKGLFYLIKGDIDVTLKTDEKTKEFTFSKDAKDLRSQSVNNKLLFTIKEGGLAGYLTSLVNYRSFVGLQARTDVYVGFISNETLERLCDKYYLMYLRIAENLTSLLSPRMLKLDHALEWVHLSASETLFNQGDPANGIYLVLNGRLRQFQHSDLETKAMAIGELAQEESFGELEVLTATNRSLTTVAIRDSELARIPRTLFEILALEHPSIMIRVSRLVAHKMMAKTNDITGGTKFVSDNGNRYDLNLVIPPVKNATHSNTYNNTQGTYSRSRTYKTITILPTSDDLPVEVFASKLVAAFQQVGRSTIGLNQEATLTHLGRHAFDRLAKLKQSGYFSEIEKIYDIVVYIADPAINPSWTKTCISQGDCILLLCDANGSTDIGDYESLLVDSSTTARTELILLHPETFVEPGLTHKWLVPRPWVDAHHHIRFPLKQYQTREGTRASKGPGRMSLLDKIIQAEISRKTQHNISKLVPLSIKSKVESFSYRFMKRQTQYYTPLNAYKDDFLRLARILSGQAIGLVLGGGGAKGISHLGVIQALEESGIPVDMIGGTSIGSFVGGLYAKDYSMLAIFGRTKKFCGRISSIWRMMTDLTWPVTSYTTGHEFNRGIWKAFGDTRIEDFWLPFFCNSTNITESVQEVHSFGYAWRYIRASMSLAGLLPPLEENGSMLLDGGYVDNLPVWEMKARGCDTIFAIDVGSIDDKTPMSYGDSLNGFWIIFNRLNPFSSHPNIPDMTEIQIRLGYVASVNALEKAKHTKGVIYARPPIDQYNTLEFSKFEEIYDLGVNYGRKFFQNLIDENRMPIIPGKDGVSQESDVPEFLLHRRNSI